MRTRSIPIIHVLVLLVAACCTAISGNGGTVPLDSHEVFVSRTAEEMLHRGSLLVPYLNGELRVKKPPLSYWLVMAADSLNGRDKVINEWEARSPSIVAGIGMVLITWWLGAFLFDSACGLLAGLVVAGSSGFVTYTHSARPEMLYAFFCAAALACWCKSWKRCADAGESTLRIPSSCRWWAWLGWAMVGLAVLTKGPQIPLLMALGLHVFLFRSDQRSVALRIARPISGLLVASLVCLWWFVWIWTSEYVSGGTMANETVGRIFDFTDEPLSRYLDPYYIYRTGGLVLPWFMLYITAIGGPWIKELNWTDSARVLWWVVAVLLIALHITLNRRWYYALPILAPLAILMAETGLQIGRQIAQSKKAWVWTALVALHLVGMLVAIVVMRMTESQDLRPSILATISVGVAVVAGLFVVFRSRSAAVDVAATSLVAMLLVGVVCVTAAASSGGLWGDQRLCRRDFALEVGRHVAADQLLIGWYNDWQVEQHYNHRVIPTLTEPGALVEALRHSRGGWLLTNSTRAPQLPVDLQVTILHRALDDDENELQLWQVTD